MNFVLERVNQPEIEPVTLAQMKTHLREFTGVTTYDTDITNLIIAAREWVEDYTGRALIDQVWRLTISNGALISGDAVKGYMVPGYYCGTFRPTYFGEILLRKSPILAITSFKSVNAAGVETAVDAATYELRDADSKWPKLFGLSGATWVSGTFRITFRAGYANRDGTPQEGAEVVPVRLIQAMKLWAEAMYDRDEKMMPILLETAESIARPERCELGMA